MSAIAPDGGKLFSFHAPCPRGLEDALVDELRALGAGVERVVVAGVRFVADRETAWRVNLHSRIASRVLQQVAQAPYRSEDDLYRLARETPWELWHAPLATLRVDFNAVGSPLRSLQFAALRIKDGIVDRIREASGERPSVDTRRPERSVHLFVDAQQATLYLDWSGQPLFKRGWRVEGGDAPLKENLAAGLLATAHWQVQQPLLDPFCGSGTIAIEAADIASGLPAGRRRRFAFERFRGFDARRWQRLRDDAIAAAPALAARQGNAPILGSDISEAAVAFARQNLAASGLPATAVQWRQLDALHLTRPPGDGLIVTNPPYGERLDMKGRQSMADADRFWGEWGRVLKGGFAGWSACLFTSDLALPGRLRFKESRRTPLYNGAIECRLFRFDLYRGSRRADAAAPVQSTTQP